MKQQEASGMILDDLSLKGKVALITGGGSGIGGGITRGLAEAGVHAAGMKLFDSSGKLLNKLLDAVLAAVFFFDPADSDILAAESLMLLNYRIGIVNDSVERKVG